jgi:predicted Zn-dependent protease/uncharacterized membrane protein
MFSPSTNAQLITAVVVLVFFVVVAVAGFVHHRRTRTRALRNRFGSEYDRAVPEHGSSRKAEAKLADRETRADARKIREPGATERKRFVTGWQTAQSRFVDHPKAAVTEADDLITALLEARGYPKDSFEQPTADISVIYPRVMENYRVRRLRPSPGEEYRSSGWIFPPGSSHGAEIKPNTHQSSFPEYLLPAILLSVVFAGTAIAGGAQQTTSSADSTPAAQLSLTDPDSQITPEDIGDSMLVHKRYQAAIESYKYASNDSPEVWNKRGIAYQMLFDLKDAEHCYRQSLLLRPDHPWVLNNLGTVYDAQGDFRKSEAIYRKALALEATSARITANLGTSLMVQNKYHEGAEIYKRALALDPDVFDTDDGPVAVNGVPLEQHAAINYYKARNFAQAGMIERAINYLRKALSEGFTNSAKVIQDSSFDRLHGNPAFERLVSEHTK